MYTKKKPAATREWHTPLKRRSTFDAGHSSWVKAGLAVFHVLDDGVVRRGLVNLVLGRRAPGARFTVTHGFKVIGVFNTSPTECSI